MEVQKETIGLISNVSWRHKTHIVEQVQLIGEWFKNHLYWDWYPKIAYSFASSVLYFFPRILLFAEKNAKYQILPS